MWQNFISWVTCNLVYKGYPKIEINIDPHYDKITFSQMVCNSILTMLSLGSKSLKMHVTKKKKKKLEPHKLKKKKKKIRLTKQNKKQADTSIFCKRS